MVKFNFPNGRKQLVVLPRGLKMARNFRKNLKIFFLNFRRSLENKNYFTFENTNLLHLFQSVFFKSSWIHRRLVTLVASGEKSWVAV